MSLKFDKKDFAQLTYRFVMINETSGTEERDVNTLRAQEIDKDSMRLQVPTKSCQPGHTVTILMFKGSNPKIPKKLSSEGNDVFFSLVGKVKEKLSNEDEKETSIIVIKFTQYDNYRWDEIIREISERQSKVTDTIKKIKVNERY